MVYPSYMLSNEFTSYEDLFLKRFHHVETIHKDTIILSQEDDRSRECFYILEGTAIFTLQHENGKQRITTFRGKGTIFPLYYAYKSTSVERISEFKALTDMKMIRMDKSDLVNLMKEYPDLFVAMCNAWGDYALALYMYTIDEGFETAYTRVCNFLYFCLLTPELSDGRTIPITHEKIAKSCGLSRENVSRVISRLVSEKIAETIRGGIKILDEDRILKACSYVIRM